tara:strand:+ start:161 stop:676 length:516 start_codon:yes stop_codon:yes gene_type:complete
MPNKSVRRKRQKGGWVPTGKTLREARERRQRIQHQDTLNNLFPEVPPDADAVQENLERRLDALTLAQDEQLHHTRRLSSGDDPRYHSGSVRVDHPRTMREQYPLTIEEMDELILNPTPPQRRNSVGGIKKRRSRRHKKQTKSRKKSKNNKKSRQKGKSLRKHKKSKGKRRH